MAKTRAVAYLRVSTEKQADKGVSLDAQRAKVEAYAQLYELELVEVVVDAGVSAKTLDRAGLQRVLEMLKERQAEAFLVVKLDRLTGALSTSASWWRTTSRTASGRFSPWASRLTPAAPPAGWCSTSWLASRSGSARPLGSGPRPPCSTSKALASTSGASFLMGSGWGPMARGSSRTRRSRKS